MAGLLSSWWSGKPAEEKEEKSEVKEGEGEGEKESSENKEASWVSGLEGTHESQPITPLIYDDVSSGIVKNVTEYAVTVGETVKTRVQEAVSKGPTLISPFPSLLLSSCLSHSPFFPHHTYSQCHS